MIVWRWLLYSLATYLLIAGLWDHDWRLIFAGIAVWLIYPAISTPIHDDTIELPVCSGCSKGAMIPGCPVHDEERRKAA